MSVTASTACGLAALLRASTKILHVQAERSGVMALVLRGHATREAHVLLLRNLLPAYRALEAGLEAHRLTPGVRRMARPDLYRAAALESDLCGLVGQNWADEIVLLPAAEDYATAIGRAGHGDGAGLIAHAYTRYMGDLSGGQIMQDMLIRTLGLGAESLAFYRFPGIADLTAYKELIRRDLDDAGREIADPASVAAEAAAAFRHNIEISMAVAGHLQGVA